MDETNFLFSDKHEGFFRHSIKCSAKAFEAEAVEIHQQPRKTINFAQCINHSTASGEPFQQEVVKSTSQKEKYLYVIQKFYQICGNASK